MLKAWRIECAVLVEVGECELKVEKSIIYGVSVELRCKMNGGCGISWDGGAYGDVVVFGCGLGGAVVCTIDRRHFGTSSLVAKPNGDLEVYLVAVCLVVASSILHIVNR